MEDSPKSSFPEAVETSSALAENAPVTTENPMGPYRDPIVIDKDDTDSESSSSESEDDDNVFVRTFEQRHPLEKGPPLDIETDYVPSLPQRPTQSAVLLKLGHVSAIIDGVVVIKSLPGTPPLDKDSPVYFCDRRPLGTIYDTFGPTKLPMYAVVHENRAAPQVKKANKKSRGAGQQVSEQGPPSPKPSKIEINVEVGDEVFYDKYKFKRAPLEKLLKEMPSDATGPNDEELSDDDFSDDEQKPISKPKKRNFPHSSESVGIFKHIPPSKSQPSYGGRGVGAPPSQYAQGPIYQQYQPYGGSFQQQQQTWRSPMPTTYLSQSPDMQFSPSGEMSPYQPMTHGGLAHGPDPICLTKPPPQYSFGPPPQMAMLAQQQQQQQQQNPSDYHEFLPSSSYRYPGTQGN